MRRKRYQLDNLDTQENHSDGITQPQMRENRKKGNLRESPNGNLIVSASAKDTVPGWHFPIIDLDIPHIILPSRSPGHGHLYLNKAVRHEAYHKLLKALRDCELIGQGNLNQFEVDGFTGARLPLDYDKYPNIYDDML